MAAAAAGAAGTVAPPPAWLASFSLVKPPPGFVDNPYPFYAALREHAPVHRLDAHAVLLTRYDDVIAVYRHPAASSDKQREFAPKFGDGSPLFEHHTTSLVFNDAPLHTRVRRLLMGALNQRAIARMEAGVVALVDGLLIRRGETYQGHEFHRWQIAIEPETRSAGPQGAPLWRLAGWGASSRPEGWTGADLHASWLHLHWAGSPQLVRRLAARIEARADQEWRSRPSSGEGGRLSSLAGGSVEERVEEKCNEAEGGRWPPNSACSTRSR